MEVQAVYGESPHYGLMRNLGQVIDRMPEAALITTMLNYTGDQRLLTEVLPAVAADLQSGKLDPINAPDAAVAAMTRLIDATIGKEQRLRSLNGVGGLPGVAGSPLDLLDRALAVDALLPMLSAASTRAPDAPAGLSPAFDWQGWVDVAAKLIGGHEPSPEERLIAARLLSGVKEFGPALDHVKAAGDAKEARAAAFDLMLRLDRMCGDLLKPAAPMQEDVFRFDR